MVVPNSSISQERPCLFRFSSPSNALVKPSERIPPNAIRLGKDEMKALTTPYNRSLLPRETGNLAIIKELTARMNRWSQIPENESLSRKTPFRDHYRIVLAITADIPEWEVVVW